jgi:2-aminobenzoate-CoA ligase
VKAFVVCAPGHEAGEALAAELQVHVKATIAPYKYPREIEFAEALPKTATGKLQRYALRSEVSARS